MDMKEIEDGYKFLGILEEEEREKLQDLFLKSLVVSPFSKVETTYSLKTWPTDSSKSLQE